MALKDLIAGKSEAAEATIEALVTDYVRYDPKGREIHLTAAGSRLSNKAKVLVYLTALQGWIYVIEEAVEGTSTPADMESVLHIPGGSLRPVLKDLKDRHIITQRDGSYFIRVAGLEVVKAELHGGDGAARRRDESSGDSGSKEVARSRKATRAKPREKAKRAATKELDDDKRTGRGAGKGKKNGLRGQFDSWIANGFFQKPRTLANVQQQFHKEGAIVPRTSIPGLLLSSVRNKILVRDKKEVDGKSVWVYQQP